MPVLVDLQSEQSPRKLEGGFVARASAVLLLVIIAALTMVAMETHVLAANGLLDDYDLLLGLALS